MLFFDGVLGLVLFALWVFCLIDVITTDESLCRNMPKTWWILDRAAARSTSARCVWLVAGRPWPSTSRTADLPYRGNRARSPRPTRSTTVPAGSPRPTPTTTRSSCGRSASARRSSGVATARRGAGRRGGASSGRSVGGHRGIGDLLDQVRLLEPDQHPQPDGHAAERDPLDEQEQRGVPGHLGEQREARSASEVMPLTMLSAGIDAERPATR